MVAASAESMTRVPMGSNYTLHAQAGLSTGPWSRRILDRYSVAEFSPFIAAQMIADKYRFARGDMDAFALASHRKAAAAIESGAFRIEIVPVATDAGIVDRDEGVRYDATLESIGAVKPIHEGGAIIAANASQMTDGASAVLVVSEQALKTHKPPPIARVHTLVVTAGDPVIMLEEPIPATARVLQRAGLRLEDIDLFEVNEAFASIPMASLKATGANPAKLDVNCGAIALGHPLGATGTKLLETLIHALRARGGRYGLQTMCEGGGVANATIVEVL